MYHIETYSVKLFNKMMYPVRALLGHDSKGMSIFRILKPRETFGPISINESTYLTLQSNYPNIKIIE